MKKALSTLITLLVFCIAIGAQPLPNGKTYKVALLVPTGAELLDFAGPGEAFTQAPGFEVFLASLNEEPIRSQGFMTITPNYSYKNCPQPDIVLIPGGGTMQLINDPGAIAWIKQHYENGGTLLTVCTGAVVAAEAGLLEGKKATTYHNAFNRLRASCKDCEVLEGVRYVDNGRLITTAGISAGIDGALHLISRIKGKDIAEEAARNMEYDKWVPNEGHMNYDNEFVSYLKHHGLAEARQKYRQALADDPQSLFFAGELKNLAAEYSAAGAHEKAKEVLEFCADYYPGEAIIYQQLRGVYTDMGQPVPPTPENFMELALQGRADEVVTLYEKAKKQFPEWILFEESRLNWAGYQLLQKNKVDGAIKIFRINMDANPRSFNVYDSLAEAYWVSEDYETARKYYNKSLELNPNNENAQRMLAKMKGR